MTIEFDDVRLSAGIDNRGGFYSVEWGDYDGDGDPDLYASNHTANPTLHRNNGDGTFTEVTSSVIQPPNNAVSTNHGLGCSCCDCANLSDDLEDIAVSNSAETASSEEGIVFGDQHGAAWADFDNDGDLDLIQVVGGFQGSGAGPNQLYVNENGILVDRASELGVDFPFGRGRNPLWLDFNQDGLLDLFIGGPPSKVPDVETTPVLFRQTENGTFVDATQEAGYDYGALFGVLSDVSGDGNLDFILGGRRLRFLDTTSNSLVDVTNDLFASRPGNIKPSDIAIVDFTGDLRPDIFLLDENSDFDSRFFVNTDNGFVERTVESGLSGFRGRSTVSGDFDNDGDRDIFITGLDSNALYENQGDGTFVAIPNAGGAFQGVGDSTHPPQVATADYDLDGFLDMYASYEGFREDRLFRNQANDNGNNWIQIDLKGVNTNKDAIGSQVIVTAGNLTQLGERDNGIHGVAAQDFQRLHFGLATNNLVNSIEVKWANGVNQKTSNVTVDRIVEIVEGIGFNGNDTIVGSDGEDSFIGNEGRDVLNGEDGNDFLDGGTAGDRLSGGKGDDILDGGNGKDKLSGDVGDDLLIGNRGDDTLTGGAGADRFRYLNQNEKRDAITDFVSGEDTLEFVANRFGNLSVGTLTEESFVLGNTALDNNDRFIYNSANGDLFFDPDGTGNQNQILIVTLINEETITTEDIVLI